MKTLLQIDPISAFCILLVILAAGFAAWHYGSKRGWW